MTKQPDGRSGERKERITDIYVQKYMWIHEMTLNFDHERRIGGRGDSERMGVRRICLISQDTRENISFSGAASNEEFEDETGSRSCKERSR